MVTFTKARREKEQERQKSSVRFTYGDYLQFPDDGKRFEIIDGELFMSPSPTTRHQRIIQKLHLLLGSFLATKQIGEAFISPLDVLLSESDVVQPDIFVVLNENQHIITEKNILGVPDFIIEIVSSSNRAMDTKRKRALYETYGVK